jgi:hypothetical protein
VIISLIVLTGCGGGAGTGGSTAAEVDAGAATATGGATAVAAAPPARALGAGTPSPGLAPAPSAETAPAGDADAGDELPANAPAARPQLILEAGGLGIAVDDTRVEHLPFGTSAGAVRAAVSRLLGPLTTRRRSDCPHGTRTVSSAHGFELLFRGSHFAGWTDTGAPGRSLTTGDGIGVGITVGALQDSGTAVTVRRADGGTAEWTSGPGGLDGRATSTGPHARVTLVSSGETCPTR